MDRVLFRRKLANILCCLVFIIFTGSAISKSSKDDEPLTQNIVTKAERATVIVRGRNGQGEGGLGTGFFASTNGHVLTNYHVISGATKAMVERRDGKRFLVDHIIGFHPKLDVALLKVKGGNKEYLEFAQPDSIDLDDKLFILGHPHGHTWTLTKGYLAGKRTEYGRPVIQFSADISPGNSGGPVLLSNGKVCGIATYIEKKAIAFNDGSYILDPSKVLKFGISVDAFGKCMSNSHSKKYGVSSIGKKQQFADNANLMAGILDISHNLLVKLRNGLKKLKVERQYKYDKTYKDIHGNYRQVASEAIIYDAKDFIYASIRLEAINHFLNNNIVNSNNHRNDSISSNWKKSVNHAIRSINAILESDRASVSDASKGGTGAKKEFNESCKFMYKAIKSVREHLDKYGYFITEPYVEYETIKKLETIYYNNQMSL